MRLLILFSLLVLSVTLTLADSGKSVVLRKTAAPIVIDGVIDPVWNTADSINDFVQFQPYPQTAPRKKTTAKVLTTDDAIYCLMVCMDSIENIQQNTGTLDDMGGDIVSIMFDTFNDNQTAYKFAVTAAGVRADCRLLDDARNRDYSWDGVWFSDAKVYPWGFVIEMEIPYRTIQYKEGESSWGLDFDRWIPSINEDIYWIGYEKNEGQRISKFGELQFNDFRPTAHGLNLEIYPVGLVKETFFEMGEKKNKFKPDAGIDIFYNPSQSLTFQLTANPDFAQIEADPFDFNISRYESHFSERRPFFTQGNEVFAPAGKQRNSGFYTPLELFYSRRIGKKLIDGSEVPLYLGTKAFGRVDDWEYGGFLAMTGEKQYDSSGITLTEARATFAAARIKKQVLDNSSLGLLFVGKQTATDNYGVLDIDGAFRSSNWQLAYQLARSFKNTEGDFAVSAGFTQSSTTWMTLMRGRYIGKKFDIGEVGYVPWTGTSSIVALTGPVWYFETGDLNSIDTWFGPTLGDERVDNYTDLGLATGVNMQFRSNWGYEIDLSLSKCKDADTIYTSYEIDLSTWFNPTPKWSGNIWGGYTNTYNFRRSYLSFYTWGGASASWKVLNNMEIGTSLNAFVEGNPDNKIEEITYNGRPYVTFIPFNDFSLRLYVDNTYLRSTKKIDQVLVGFLFSYSFLPKSWIYFALNDVANRSNEYDAQGILLPNRLHTTDLVSVFKIKYLYYL